MRINQINELISGSRRVVQGNVDFRIVYWTAAVINFISLHFLRGILVVGD